MCFIAFDPPVSPMPRSPYIHVLHRLTGLGGLWQVPMSRRAGRTSGEHLPTHANCLFLPLPLFLLIGRGLAPTILLNICVAGWKFAIYTKWHRDFLDSLSLMCGRCFPAWGLSRFTAYLQSSWSFSVILAGKLHSFPYPRNSGLWPMVSPIKKLS